MTKEELELENNLLRNLLAVLRESIDVAIDSSGALDVGCEDADELDEDGQ